MPKLTRKKAQQKWDAFQDALTDFYQFNHPTANLTMQNAFREFVKGGVGPTGARKTLTEIGKEYNLTIKEIKILRDLGERFNKSKEYMAELEKSNPGKFNSPSMKAIRDMADRLQDTSKSIPVSAREFKLIASRIDRDPDTGLDSKGKYHPKWHGKIEAERQRVKEIQAMKASIPNLSDEMFKIFLDNHKITAQKAEKILSIFEEYQGKKHPFNNKNIRQFFADVDRKCDVDLRGEFGRVVIAPIQKTSKDVVESNLNKLYAQIYQNLSAKRQKKYPDPSSDRMGKKLLVCIKIIKEEMKNGKGVTPEQYAMLKEAMDGMKKLDNTHLLGIFKKGQHGEFLGLDTCKLLRNEAERRMDRFEKRAGKLDIDLPQMYADVQAARKPAAAPPPVGSPAKPAAASPGSPASPAAQRLCDLQKEHENLGGKLSQAQKFLKNIDIFSKFDIKDQDAIGGLVNIIKFGDEYFQKKIKVIDGVSLDTPDEKMQAKIKAYEEAIEGRKKHLKVLEVYQQKIEPTSTLSSSTISPAPDPTATVGARPTSAASSSGSGPGPASGGGTASFDVSSPSSSASVSPPSSPPPISDADKAQLKQLKADYDQAGRDIVLVRKFFKDKDVQGLDRRKIDYQEQVIRRVDGDVGQANLSHAEKIQRYQDAIAAKNKALQVMGEIRQRMENPVIDAAPPSSPPPPPPPDLSSTASTSTASGPLGGPAPISVEKIKELAEKQGRELELREKLRGDLDKLEEAGFDVKTAKENLAKNDELARSMQRGSAWDVDKRIQQYDGMLANLEQVGKVVHALQELEKVAIKAAVEPSKPSPGAGSPPPQVEVKQTSQDCLRLIDNVLAWKE